MIQFSFNEGPVDESQNAMPDILCVAQVNALSVLFVICSENLCW